MVVAVRRVVVVIMIMPVLMGVVVIMPVFMIVIVFFLPDGIVPAVRGWFESLRRPPTAAAVLSGVGAPERKAD